PRLELEIELLHEVAHGLEARGLRIVGALLAPVLDAADRAEAAPAGRSFVVPLALAVRHLHVARLVADALDVVHPRGLARSAADARDLVPAPALGLAAAPEILSAPFE